MANAPYSQRMFPPCIMYLPVKSFCIKSFQLYASDLTQSGYELIFRHDLNDNKPKQFS